LTDKSKYNKEERQMMRDYMSVARPLLSIGILFVSIFTYLVINNTIDFGKYNKTSAKDLSDFPSKVKYVLQHLTLGITWILLSMYFVIFKRAISPAMDPMSGYEKVTEAAKNNLTNSCEQFLMTAVSQLILITHLDAITILQVIPALNLLFIFGRITFWLGYPKYRAFGFMVTNLPIVFTIFYNLYSFVKLYIK
jgi:hypothetical protein